MSRKVKSFFKRIPLKHIGLLVLLGGVWSFSNAEAAIKVFSLSGTVEVRLNGETDWKPVLESDRLRAGAQVRSGIDGSAAFVCEDDGSEFHLDSTTQITIKEYAYSESPQHRVVHIKLVKGTLSVNVVKSGSARYHIEEHTLESLRQEGMPETLLVGLKDLTSQEPSEELELLAEIGNLIGDMLTARYTLAILEYANTGQNVFTLETEGLELDANDAAGLTMIVHDEARQTDVLIERGRVTMHRLNDRGAVRIFGLSNAQTQEGLQLSLDESGGFVGVTVDECRISSETNGPISGYYALIGTSDNLVSIRNEAGSSQVKVSRDDEESFVELEGGQEALFGIPVNRQLSLESEALTSLSLGFCKQYSSFVFATTGCFNLNGREECCGDVSYTETSSPDTSPPPKSPPSAEPPDSGGAYTPPEKPPIKPGSPILPTE